MPVLILFDRRHGVLPTERNAREIWLNSQACKRVGEEQMVMRLRIRPSTLAIEAISSFGGMVRVDVKRACIYGSHSQWIWGLCSKIVSIPPARDTPQLTQPLDVLIMVNVVENACRESHIEITGGGMWLSWSATRSHPGKRFSAIFRLRCETSAPVSRAPGKYRRKYGVELPTPDPKSRVLFGFNVTLARNRASAGIL